MLPNAFIDKPSKPTGAELSAALGPSESLWKQLVADLAKENNVEIQEWKSISRKYGWSLRLRLKQRNIVYLSPHCGCFTAIFILGDKAVKAAHEAGLPASVIKMLDEARRYVEGTGLRVEVKGPKDIVIVKKLTAIKLQN